MNQIIAFNLYLINHFNLYAFISIFLILGSDLSIAAAVNDSKVTITGRREQEVSFRTICSSRGKSYTLLMEVIDQLKLSCTGVAVAITSGCAPRLESGEWLLLGEVKSKREKTATCIYGQDLRIVRDCQKLPPVACKDPKQGCLQLQAKSASRLKLIHASVTKLELLKTGKRTLNCYFSN
ncbi:MAG: hypothetical protein HN353_05395 [Bdellovibrionales bacterium]|jgi:hypothetical protein|nr:hypothetical protein [Bdellovibrionales bacterium]MBT3525123.1 hypothetical protein [Bdellovibrionales bacterium]MBT7768003.1 hypothetical protein [Bdellovibrionales bacterium]